MATQHTQHLLSAETYLQNELRSDTKHQLIEGEAYAMGGASENHNLLAGNLFSEFKMHLKGTSCKTFMADMKVQVMNDFYYPDVMVVCAADDQNEYVKKAPVILWRCYPHQPASSIKPINASAVSLFPYVLIEQDKGEIEVFSRDHHWQAAYYYLGDHITFHSLGITMPVAAIYAQVTNEDVLNYVAQQTNGELR